MKKTIAIVAVFSLLRTAVPAASGSSWAQTVSSEPANSIASIIQPFVDNHTLAGAVMLVASKDKVLSLRAIGYADVAAKKPMRTDDLFWIASMSKPMTGTALMMLVDEGKVSVDDPVEKYLPEFSGQMLAVEQGKGHVLLKKPAHPVAVRNVLSHTSGLVKNPPPDRLWDALSLREAVLGYASSPLKFEPGSKYEYCNAGINTVGRIVEMVSGMPYEEFMENRLFKPLGMKDTTFWPSEEQIRRLAKSYKLDADKAALVETPIFALTYPLTTRNRSPFPAGGLFSTATDISIFCRMILSGGVYEGKRYLSETAVQQMTSTQTNNLLSGGKSENGYGFGWATSRKVHDSTGPGSGGSFGHGGAYATDMWLDPQHQLITVLMVQRVGLRGPDGGKIRTAFRKAAVDAFAK